MLDVYMIKNGKFVKIWETVDLTEMMNNVYEIFCLQTRQKFLDFDINILKGVPKIFKSDKRRMM